MAQLKGFIFVILGLALLITAVSLLMPSRVMTAQTVMINAPKEKIESAIADLGNWKYWHPVFSQPGVQVSLDQDASSKVKSASWSSGGKKNKLQSTGQDTSQYSFTLNREHENEMQHIFTITPIHQAGGFQVEWRVLTHLKWYPWEKFSGIFFANVVGPGNQQALEQLKKYAETP